MEEGTGETPRVWYDSATSGERVERGLMERTGRNESAAVEKGGALPRPVIKWAGGKRQLLPQLLRYAPPTFDHYWEPFIGSAALFFELRRLGRIGTATLGDVNAELIGVYKALRDAVEPLIECLREHEEHKFDRDYFYEVRNWDREPGWQQRPPVARAARLIYLNKTCYNGLHRVNRRGEFNVPWGSYANPCVCDVRSLQAASTALQGVELRVDDFRTLLADAKAGDLIYFDPPYVPVSATASFTAYSAHPFGVDEHRELAAAFAELVERGCHALLSNSDTPLARALYGEFEIQPALARRAISAQGSARGLVGEVIVVGRRKENKRP